MKFGVYHLIWAPPPSNEALVELGRRAKSLGADVLELAIGRDPLPFDPRTVARSFADIGIEGTLVTTLSAERDIASPDAAVRRNGMSYLRGYLDHSAALGSPVLSGPFFGPVWNPILLSPAERAERWARCVEALSALAQDAQRLNVRIAVEPLSRFHTAFLNTTADAVRLVDEVGHPNVGILFDTFQMSIEEKSLGAAIRLAGSRVFHVHASENDRGTPGSGHVDWKGVASALKEIRYDGCLVIEAFNPDNADLANFVKVWRRLEVDPDTLARDGLRFLRGLFR
jgi:D-psicose/D-tagatose/L-ribulose 3-epimerase